MKRPAVLLAVLALGGCTVGPNFRSPQPEVPSPGRFDASSPAATPLAEPPAQWWRLYQDPALDGYVAQALAENKDLRVAAANLSLARAVLEEARSGRLPSTNASGGGQYGVTTAELSQSRQTGQPIKQRWTYSAGFDASYEIDLFGRITRSIEAARRDLQAEEAARDVTRVTVAAETARAYADACAYGEAAAVARRSLAVVAQTFQVLEVQRRAGTISDLEVSQSRALYDQARAAIPTFDAQRRASLYQLAVLTGAPPEQVPAAAAACVHPPELARPIPTGDGAALIRRRPDVRQAERALAANVARIGVATADLYPTISLGGSVASVANTVGGLGRASSISYALGPLLNWSFPNIVPARARIRQAEARAQASLASFDSTILTALSETEQSLSTYAALLDRREALRSARRNDADALQLATLRYTAGSTAFLALLDAQRTLIGDENALAAADEAVASASVNVFKALGGGWQDAPDVAPASLDRARQP